MHATKVDYVGRKMVERLKEIIPRQMVHIAIQAVVNSRVIARGNLQAYKKDVTAKLVSSSPFHETLVFAIFVIVRR